MSSAWVAASMALWVVVLGVGLLVLGLHRRVVAVLERVQAQIEGGSARTSIGAEPGSEVPPFEVVDGEQQVISSAELLGERAVFLLMGSRCVPCRKVADDLPSATNAIDGVPLCIIFEDLPEAREFQVPPGVPVYFDADERATRAFRSLGTPQAFVVDPPGFVIDRLVPNSVEDLYRLVNRSRHKEVMQSVDAPEAVAVEHFEGGRTDGRKRRESDR